MRRTAVLLGFALLACVRPNPAFDELDGLGDEESGANERGEGEGKQDGDERGDGDGDGDGDDEPGDGDGDHQPGDGDGDLGDGDGDDGDEDAESETGDGDGDNNTACARPPQLNDIAPAMFQGTLELSVLGAPGFAAQEPGCLVLFVCRAEQEKCDAGSDHVVMLKSGTETKATGEMDAMEAIRLRFEPDEFECGMPPLIFAANEFLQLDDTRGEPLKVFLPCFMDSELDLWVGQDGSTFYDRELQQVAAAAE